MDSVKKKIQGVVVSDKNDKTVVVSVRTIKAHKKYCKRISSDKRFMAHDPENKCKIGDTVEIEESRSISKNKKWSVLRIISE